MRWPTGTPPNIRSQLQALADAHELSGVAPQILAAIAKYTSNWGLTGLGINATGFGGYFGQHVGWSYPGRPQGFTAAQLVTPRTFGTQAKVAAATLAGYGWSLAASLAIYVLGSPVDVTSGFVRYVLDSTGANGKGPVTQASQQEGADMAVAVGTGLIVVTGVTASGHKVVFTAALADRQDARQWSIIDLTDAGQLQGVKGVTAFLS
jgi:hypothetical protein